MRKYNFIRPLLLIVTNICILLGMEKEAAGSVGFIAMIVTAFIFYKRIARNRKM